MFKEQMNKIKSLMIRNTEEKPKDKKDKKKIENLVAFLIILIVTLIVINSILKGDDKKEKTNTNIDSEYKELASKSENSFDENVSNDELEKKIENILGTMSGVRKS